MVAMERQSISDLSFFSGKCISNRIADKGCVDFSAEAVCDNIPATKIHDNTEIIGSLRCNDVSDICHPAVIHLLLDESAIQKIFIAMAALPIQRIGTSAPDLRQKIRFPHVVQHSQWTTFN